MLSRSVDLHQREGCEAVSDRISHNTTFRFRVAVAYKTSGGNLASGWRRSVITKQCVRWIGNIKITEILAVKWV